MDTQHTYTAHIEHHGEWWIGWILEVSGVTCQERTREELLESLKMTLLEILAYDEEQARQRAIHEITPVGQARLILTCSGSGDPELQRGPDAFR